jgi:predicted RNase H-like nuclease (RuvC/YqgF family)
MNIKKDCMMNVKIKRTTLELIIKSFEEEVERYKDFEDLNKNLWKQIYELKKENEMLRNDLKELSNLTFKK